MDIKLLVLVLFSSAMLFIHSCAPFSEKNAEEQPFYTDGNLPGFQIANDPMPSAPNTKRCKHCGNFIDVNMSAGECMFMEAASTSSDKLAKEYFAKAKEQLEAEAAEGRVESRIMLGFIAEYGMFGRPDEITAARHYRLAADTGKSKGQGALAAFWIRGGDNLEAAEELLKKAIAVEKDNISYYATLADLYFIQGRSSQAFEAIETAYKLTPGDSRERSDVENYVINHLMTLAVNGKTDDAVKNVDRFLKLSPANLGFLKTRADIFAGAGKYEDAEREYTRLINTDPNFIWGYLGRAAARSRRKHFNEAMDDINVALKRQVTFAPVWIQKAWIELDSGKYPEALDSVNRALEFTDAVSAAYHVRGLANFQMGRYKEALKDFEKALLIEPIPEYSTLIADTKIAMKDYAAAKADLRGQYEKSLYQPGDALRLAAAELMNGDVRDALNTVTDDSILQSDFAPVKLVGHYLRAVSLIAAGENPDKEIKTFKKLLTVGKRPEVRPFVWNSTPLEIWLDDTSYIPPEAKKQISELTSELKNKLAAP